MNPLKKLVYLLSGKVYGNEEFVMFYENSIGKFAVTNSGKVKQLS